MPIRDPAKLRLARKYRLFIKICRRCGARNASSADRCRRCRSGDLRWKKRELRK